MSDIRSVLNTQAFSLIENTDGSPDPIRNIINSYWDYNGGILVYDTGNSYNSSDDEANTISLNFDLKDKPNKFSDPIKLDGEDGDISITMKTYTQKISVTPRYPSDIEAVAEKNSAGRIKVDPEAKFNSYIENSIIPSIGIPFSEFKLDLDSPLEYASDVQNFSAIAGTVNFVYNYGLESYENSISQNIIAESELNNFYKFKTLRESPSIFTVGTSSRRRKSVVPFRVPFTKENVSEKLISSTTMEENIQDFFINDAGFVRALGMQEKKDKFPFYNEIYLTNPARKNSTDKLEEALKDSGLIIAFCTLMNREDAKLARDEESETIINYNFTNSYLSSSYVDNTQQQFKEQSAVRVSKVKLYDIPAMLKIMYDAILTKTSPIAGASIEPLVQQDTATLRAKGFLTDGEQADYRLDAISKIGTDENTRIDYQNALDDFVEEINNLINNVDNFKRYRQVLDGAMAPYQSDVLFYRIKKFEQGSDTPIQNFWIPAEKGYRGVRYIDTQVKYGKMYRYEVCAFKMVLGSDYQFSEQSTGVINFDEDVKGYENQVSETIDQLRTLAGFRDEAKEELSSVAFSSTMLDRLVYKKMANYLRSNDVNIGIFNAAVPMAGTANNGLSQIALFANNIIENGSSQYKGINFSFNDLTEEERGDLLYIQFVWPNLTNNWILGDGPTEEGTLFDLEKAIKNAEAISFVKLIIDNQNDGQSGIVIDDLGRSELDAINRGILQISILDKVEGFSFDESLNPDDSIYKGYAYYSYLDKNIAKTFPVGGIGDFLKFSGRGPSIPGREITSILPISSEDSKLESYNLSRSPKGKKDREKEELQSFYYEYFPAEMSSTEALINQYLSDYDNFIASARKINIIADYKRMNKYNLQVNLQPSLKFAELPYFSSEGMILDNPPIYPNVNVVTYRGVSDTFSFFMNSGQGQIEIEPISFSDGENTFIANYRKSKKLNDFQPFLYKSDETENLGTIFEIRRLEEPPQNYQSFREARVSRVSETISSGKALPAATFDEKIMSNKKYYYIFRVSDRRGTISYPSGVIEIEIVENSGIIYPLIKPYEFEKPKTDTTKSLKRLLNVVPRITQVVPPADTASYSGLSAGATTILGREEEALFGKQFKLRLTSKKTGKVVDLNLNFNANVVERAEAE